MSERLTNWMDGYIAAWKSNKREDIERLFTPDAVYDPQTNGGVWRGLYDIVEGWREIADKPGSWEFEWSPLVEQDAVAVITGRTRYLEEPPKTYRNLWVIVFDSGGRCREFTEWWVREKQSDQTE